MAIYTNIIDRINNVTDNTNFYLELLPTTAKIEISGKCTLSCNFCASSIAHKNRQTIMSISDFNIVLNFIKTILSINEVGLFYIGESALNLNMPYFYMLLKKLNYFTYLTTNGTIFKTVNDSIPYIDSLKISWNYTSCDDFIKKTNSTPLVYKQIKENINNFYITCHKYNKALYISTIIGDNDNKENYFNELNTLKYDLHYWLPLLTLGGFTSNGLGGVVGELNTMRNALPCWSLFKGLYIDSNLNLRTCCFGHNDCHIAYNIKNNSFFICDKVKNMRQKQINGIIPTECINCLSTIKINKK